jgi:hypothetical protein
LEPTGPADRLFAQRKKGWIFISITSVCCGAGLFQRAAKGSFNCESDVAADSGPIIREDFASISADTDGIWEPGLAVAILGLRLAQLEKLRNTLKRHHIRFHKGTLREILV